MTGVGSGQHELWGLRRAVPPNSISPFFFRTSAAWGCKIGLVSSPTTPPRMFMIPSGPTSLLTIGPGPDNGGSILNQRPHMPDKSGMGATLSVPLLAGPTVGAAACPKAGAAA